MFEEALLVTSSTDGSMLMVHAGVGVGVGVVADVTPSSYLIYILSHTNLSPLSSPPLPYLPPSLPPSFSLLEP